MINYVFDIILNSEQLHIICKEKTLGFKPVAMTDFSHLQETLNWVGKREENLTKQMDIGGKQKDKPENRLLTMENWCLPEGDGCNRR